ncbi:hypothetical protein [Streptomyces buecherae]|uniref:hypothetical protein n=1 Tax=Streptomyces buecherae TaxID=2763006 RepID=UPI00369FBE72
MTRYGADPATSPLLPSVVRVVHGWSEDPALAARRLDGLPRTATAPELTRLEADYRRLRYGLGSLGPGALLDDPARDDAAPDAHALAVAALMSFDRSGYLREAGVARLADAPESFPIPFLLPRLNDPVEEVRSVAQRAVATRVGSEHVELLVRLLPLLDGLRERRRARHLLSVVEDLLQHAGVEAMWRGARPGDAVLRACCLRWLARADPVAAVTAAFATRDPALWQWAARTATSARMTPAELDVPLPHLERGSSPHIRLRALRARVRQPHGEAHLRRAMLDRDARVRYHARAALYARGHTDLAPQVYRDALRAPTASDGLVIGALGGLADLGSARDVPRVLDFVTHSTARVRAEAWRTLDILDPRALDRRVAELAGDPSGKARRHLPSRHATTRGD